MYGIGLAKGLVVTLKNLVSPNRMFTVQYPDRKVSPWELAKASSMNFFTYMAKNPVRGIKAAMGMITVPVRLSQHARFRGEEFTWYEQRCTGCASCAKYCPLGIIRIVTSPSGEEMQEGEKYHLDVFDIDLGRCMFCGLCVEACPYDALHMGSGFEEGQYRRDALIIDKQRLNSQPKKPSTWFRPQISRDKEYHPHADQEIDWNEAGRHEKPSLEQQEEQWAKR